MQLPFSSPGPGLTWRPHPQWFGGKGGYYNSQNLKLRIDPKVNTTHNTALYIEGSIIITFTPNSVAPQDVKKNGVPSTFKFGLTNSEWKYENQNIVTLAHDEAEPIDWGTADQTTGVFTFTISAAELAQHITLTEFVLDTKAKYDAYNTALGKGQLTISVSDGTTAQ